MRRPSSPGCISAWSQAPAGMYRARPTLVFAVLGQARADGRLSPEDESVLIGKLLTFWALKTTLDTSYECAAMAANLRRRATPLRETPKPKFQPSTKEDEMSEKAGTVDHSRAWHRCPRDFAVALAGADVEIHKIADRRRRAKAGSKSAPGAPAPSGRCVATGTTGRDGSCQFRSGDGRLQGARDVQDGERRLVRLVPRLRRRHGRCDRRNRRCRGLHGLYVTEALIERTTRSSRSVPPAYKKPTYVKFAWTSDVGDDQVAFAATRRNRQAACAAAGRASGGQQEAYYAAALRSDRRC